MRIKIAEICASAFLALGFVAVMTPVGAAAPLLTLEDAVQKFHSDIRPAVAAFPRQPHYCGLSYRYESYGFGLVSGYEDQDQRPPMNDEGCFRLGRQKGRRIRNSRGGDHCTAAINDGQAQGFRGETHVIRGPSECSNAGYIYGRSYLTAYARAGRADLVGTDCVNAYGQGSNDGKNDRMASPPSRPQAQACYMAGHHDSKIIP